ncbi:MAG: DUF1064 domain-containing protein [Marinifilaceae bacterium]
MKNPIKPLKLKFINGKWVNPGEATTKKSKFNNTKVGNHASKKEHNRANELKFLEQQGIISNLREQVKYELVPLQPLNKGYSERSVTYVADFVYIREGVEIVEDTKGFRTREYVIKRKLMKYFHNIEIKET